MTLPPFRPRSATEIVDAAIQLARRHYAPLLTLAAIVSIPSVVLGLVAVWLMPQPGGVENPFAGEAGGWLLLVSLVSICWLFVGFGALVASAAAAYVDGRALEPLAALRQALRRSVTLVLAHLLAMLAIVGVLFVGFVVLGIAAGIVGAAMGLAGLATAPGPVAALLGGIVVVGAVGAMLLGALVAFARLSAVPAAVMLEGLGVTAALRRSNRLVRGHTRRVTGVVGIMWIIYVVAYATFWALAALVVRAFELSGNIAGILVVVAYPFVASLLALVYYDLRIRREGYDLELMARALETPTARDAADARDPRDAPAVPDATRPSASEAAI